MLNIVRLFLISFVIVSTALAAPKEGEIKPKADLKPGDIKKIEPFFRKAMDEPNAENIGKLADFLEKWDKKKAFGSPLADVEAWEEIFANYRAKTAPKRLKGAGTPQSETAWFKSQGRVFEYEYAYRVPRNYKPTKPLPTVLCIPDSDADPKSYLKEVWLTGKENTALADQMVLIAASVPKEVKSRRISKGPYKNRETVDYTFEWFDLPHVSFMVRPLKEVQQLVNTDPRRIFLEGSGDGAEAALHLAAVYGLETFAGVAVRNGSMNAEHMNVVDGLSNMAVMLAQRAPHPKEKGGDKRWKRWLEFKKVVEAKKWPRLKIEESTEAAEKLDRRTLASQTVEPFIDANAKLAAFYNENQAQDYPEEFRIVTDNRLFTSGAGLKLLRHEISEGKTLDVAVKLDRAANAIRLTGEGFAMVTLFLNDRMLDLDRPIEVFVNDVLWERKRQTRSLTEMLKNMRKSPFTGNRLTTAVLAVEAIEPAAEGEGEGEGEGEDTKAGDGKDPK
jgi:poly(3-hydroxybutyrate) depolymerase